MNHIEDGSFLLQGHAVLLIKNVSILSPPESTTSLLAKQHLTLAKTLIHSQRMKICHSGGNSFEKAVKATPKKSFVWRHCWNECTAFQGDCPKGQR